MNFIKIAATALTLALGATVAIAQAPAPAAPVAPKAPVAATPPPAAPGAATAVKKAPPVKGAPRSAESLACSAELDAKNIHGKATKDHPSRRSAMAKCIAEKTGAAKKKN